VSTKSRLILATKETAATTAEDKSQVAYSAAAQNLKHMKNRLAIAQMPNEDTGDE
jgi:hypothetical protein